VLAHCALSRITLLAVPVAVASKSRRGAAGGAAGNRRNRCAAWRWFRDTDVARAGIAWSTVAINHTSKVVGIG